MATITCSGNKEAVLKALLDAGADAEIDEGTLIVNTRLGREVLGPEDVVDVQDNPRAGSEGQAAKLVIVESSRANNPDANPGGVPA